MRPQRRARMPGSTAWVHRNADLRLTARCGRNRLGQLLEAAAPRDPGIVDEDVDRPEPALDGHQHGRHLGRRPRRRRARRAPAAQGPAASATPGRPRPLAIVDGDVGTGLGEHQRDRLADAAGGARHQRHASGEINRAAHACLQCPKSPQRHLHRARGSLKSSLYLPVKRFLEKLGFEVKGEVCGCDLVALDGGSPHGGRHRRAETRLHARPGAAGRRPLGRLRRGLAGGPRLAARARPRARSARQEAVPPASASGLLSVFGIGQGGGAGRAGAVAAAARCAGAAPALSRSTAAAAAIPAAGGSTRQPIMTAYRQQALACAAALAKAPGRPRDLKGDARCAEDPAQQRLRLVRQGRARRLCAVRGRQGRPGAVEGAPSRCAAEVHAEKAALCRQNSA